jgi:hypothetical protein
MTGSPDYSIHYPKWFAAHFAPSFLNALLHHGPLASNGILASLNFFTFNSLVPFPFFFFKGATRLAII